MDSTAAVFATSLWHQFIGHSTPVITQVRNHSLLFLTLTLNWTSTAGALGTFHCCCCKIHSTEFEPSPLESFKKFRKMQMTLRAKCTLKHCQLTWATITREANDVVNYWPILAKLGKRKTMRAQMKPEMNNVIFQLLQLPPSIDWQSNTQVIVCQIACRILSSLRSRNQNVWIGNKKSEK